LSKLPDRDRWYVLAVMTVVYALSIADRFSISTDVDAQNLLMRARQFNTRLERGVVLASQDGKGSL
jgi:hypothetical protein